MSTMKADMMTCGLNTVSLSEVSPQPWRNGGGVTREVIAWPVAEAWQLRLSVAQIDKDGPFSVFPGVQRWFAVLAGEGVCMTPPNIEVRRGDAPFEFDGAIAPMCRLIDGATRDLNLMLRGDTTGTLRMVDLPFEWPAIPSTQTGSVYGFYTEHAVQLCAGPDAHMKLDIEPRSAVWCDGARLEKWSIEAAQSDTSLFVFEAIVSPAKEPLHAKL